MMFLKALLLMSALTFCSGYGPQSYRPCPTLNYKCIREYFRENSFCNPNVPGKIPKEYILSEFRFNTPNHNSSNVDKHLIVRNHDDCVFTEFYVNTYTQVVVIAIDCPNFYLESDRTEFKHSTRKEDITYNYHIKTTYPLASITMNIPISTKLNICTATAFREILGAPIIQITPKDAQTDKYMRLQHLGYKEEYERESFVDRAAPIMRYTINHLICDYECVF